MVLADKLVEPLALLAPPLPVLPLSLTLRFKLVALNPAGGLNMTWPAATNASRLAWVLVSVSVDVPEPATVTPPLLVAASVPAAVFMVRVKALLAASTSATEMPVSGALALAITAMLAGAIRLGASFTALTISATFAGVADFPPPAPLLPLSLSSTVSVVPPLAFAAGAKLRLP